MDPRITRRTAALLLLLLWFLTVGSGSFGLLRVGDALSATTTTLGTQQLSSEVLPPVADATQTATTAPLPTVRGAAAILINMDDGRVLFENSADAQRPIASTTKIMTGILALETIPLDRVIKASQKASDAGESEIWLEPGEELAAGDLLYALMVRSANDAAVALAESSAGSLEAFVEAMNAKAVELGLTNTHFANPHGLEAKEHYSSARDLATLARYAMQNAEFRKLVATEKARIPWPGREYDRVLENRNSLVGSVPFVTGIKTGYTAKAGFCLVGSGARDGVSLVSVILGEENKDAVNADSVALLEYGFTLYRQVNLMAKDVPVAELDIPYHFGEKLTLSTDRELVRTVFAADPITKTVTAQQQLTLPVDEGQTLGKVTFEVAGAVAGEVNLVATRSIEAPTLRVKLTYLWDRMMNWLGRAT
ncbi:MAG: D-alanyl-D-alanine carboxypeptidase family protein [Thermoleophilia bacterium]